MVEEGSAAPARALRAGGTSSLPIDPPAAPVDQHAPARRPGSPIGARVEHCLRSAEQGRRRRSAGRSPGFAVMVAQLGQAAGRRARLMPWASARSRQRLHAGSAERRLGHDQPPAGARPAAPQPGERPRVLRPRSPSNGPRRGIRWPVLRPEGSIRADDPRNGAPASRAISRMKVLGGIAGADQQHRDARRGRRARAGGRSCGPFQHAIDEGAGAPGAGKISTNQPISSGRPRQSRRAATAPNMIGRVDQDSPGSPPAGWRSGRSSRHSARCRDGGPTSQEDQCWRPRPKITVP